MLKNEMGSSPSLNFIAEKHVDNIPPIMQNLEKVLESAVKKETLKLSLTHKLLLDYLTHCSVDQRRSIIESLKENIPEICHSREGSRVAMICIWNADVKERKTIVKSFKGLAVKSCLDEFARRALFAIFDCVDDTKLVNSILTTEIGNNVAEVANDRFGVWVLHYLVHPRDYRVFGKGLIELLRQGDNNAMSKKPAAERYGELYGCIREPLFTFLKSNVRELILNKVTSALLLDALEPNDPSCPLQREVDVEDKEACFRAIAEVANDEFIPNIAEQSENPHIIQAGCGRFVLRKLLQSDAKQVDAKLSDFMADLPSEQLNSFTAINSGCFALMDMAKCGSKKAREAVRSCVNLAALRKSSLVGANLLLVEMLADAANKKTK